MVVANVPVSAGNVSVLVPATAGVSNKISPEVSPLNFIPDIIISGGGGTTIDIAKFFLAGFQASKEMDFIELDSFLLWVKENSEFKNQISHYAIVTKPGSGAESSKAMIINNQQNKFVLAKDYFLPNSIFYYENVFKFLPDNEKLFGLTDSLAHAWESYGSPIKNNFVNCLLRLLELYLQ